MLIQQKTKFATKFSKKSYAQVKSRNQILQSRPANKVDPDEVACSELPHLGLPCLEIPYFHSQGF